MRVCRRIHIGICGRNWSTIALGEKAVAVGTAAAASVELQPQMKRGELGTVRRNVDVVRVIGGSSLVNKEEYCTSTGENARDQSTGLSSQIDRGVLRGASV